MPIGDVGEDSIFSVSAYICPPACATATKNRNKFIALRKRTGSASVPWRVLLLIFGFFRHVGAACTSCWGAAASDGCTGDATTCPWVIAVAANSATIGAMASGRLVVDKLLPKKILRLFSYRVLKIISMLYSVRAGEGTAANSLEESTPLANFVGLLTSTKITLEEAIDEISRRIHALDRTAETFDNDLKLLNATMTAVTKVDASSISSGMYADGARLYVLAKLSRVICVSKALTYDLCASCDHEEVLRDTESRASGSDRSYGAILVRPKCWEQMVALLNTFGYTLYSLGLGHPLAVYPFFDKVVYEPLRMGRQPWPVHFELLILYMQKMQEEPALYNFGNIVEKLGSGDFMLEQAKVAAEEHYPASFFRAVRGEPRGGGDDKDKGEAKYRGKVTLFNESSKTACAAWNADKTGGGHLAKHVDSNGRCKYYHGCNQWVKDKGRSGQCLSTDHNRKEGCTYPEDQKSNKPL